jgi:transcriptional regulator with XRE-family HTH domain
MSIGHTIRKNRQKKDIKAVEIYEKLGISQSTYSKIENNKCKIDINTLKEIALIINVDLKILLDESKITASEKLEKRENTNSSDLNIRLINSLENEALLLKEQNYFLKNELQNKCIKIDQLKNKIKELKDKIA